MNTQQAVEAARIARDTRDMEIDGLDQMITTLAIQTVRAPEGPNRAQLRKVLAQLLVAQRALQTIPTGDDYRLADACIEAHR